MSTSFYSSTLDLAASTVLLTSVITLWRRSVRAIVVALGINGIALAMSVATLGLEHQNIDLAIVSLLVLIVKAFIIPILLLRVIRLDPNSREVKPLINVPSSLLAAGILTLLAFTASRSIISLVPAENGRLISLGLAAMLIGFFSLATKRKAVSQITGLLLVDNGIDLVAFLATAGVPLLIELGASLDILLVVIILHILAIKMRANLGSFSLDSLTELHD